MFACLISLVFCAAGIGHKVKSLDNPDARVLIVKNFVRKHFKSSEVFDYALEVEKGESNCCAAAVTSGAGLCSIVARSLVTVR